MLYFWETIQTFSVLKPIQSSTKQQYTMSTSKAISTSKLMLFISCFFIFASQFAYSQTTVQIGTGLDLPLFTAYGPVYRYSSTSATTTSRSNMLFTAAEMSAAGIPAGATITAVEFYKGNVASFTNPIFQSMYMANSTNTALSTTLTWSALMSTHSMVFTDAAFTVPNAIGWVSWAITPFAYTGGAFEIACEQNMAASGGASDKIQWQYTNGVATDKLVGATTATSNGATTLNGGVAGYRNRPNIKITFTPPLGDIPLGSENDFQMYPNPANDKLILSHLKPSAFNQLQLLDLAGKTVYEQQLSVHAFSQTFVIDLSKLEKGIYFLQILNESGVQTRKVVVE